MSRFVWFEHVSADVPRAQRFYAELLRWDTIPDGAYREPVPRGPSRAHWLSHLGVEDVPQAVAKTTSLGGTILAQLETGVIAVDPVGAIFALRQSTDAGPADGDFRFCWNELYTKDLAASVAFYRGVSGLGEEAMTMGDQPYTMLMAGQVPVAGIAPPPAFDPPITWQPVVAVPDADAALVRATALGAKILAPLEDVPTIGRFFVIADPLGAVLGILQRA